MYTRSGVSVWWSGAGPRVVRFAQNITQPLETWSVVNVTDSRVEVRLTYIVLNHRSLHDSVPWTRRSITFVDNKYAND